VRIHSNQDLRNLYAQLGHVLRKQCPGSQVGLLCSDFGLLGQTHFSFQTRLSFLNGGLPVEYSTAVISPEKNEQSGKSQSRIDDAA
jgi:23S rRNA G2445 N2-methylase RlmL